MSDSAIQQQAQQAKQNIQDQANTQRQLINNQASNAINDINNQANQAKSDVDTQVTTQTTFLRGQLSNQELERQKALQKVRQSQVLENRKLNSPLKPKALGTQDQIKSINDVARTNQQAIDIAKSKTEASGESVKADIENQAQASKADIQTQVDKANTDLQSQVDIANSDIDAQITSYQALESQLTPYSIANKDGTISYDISTFLIDNPDKQQTLLDFGYSQDSIDSVKVYNSALKKIEPFKTADNNYDISEYLKNNPDDVKTLLEAGFNQSDIDNTLENNKTLAKLEPFKTSTNSYDISSYLKTNPTDIQALINIGFSRIDIEDSLKTNAIINKLEPFKSVKDKVTYYDLNAYLKANPDDMQSLLDAGFTQADIDSATIGGIPSTIFTKLEPYMTKTTDKDGKTVTSINLNAYLKDHLGDIQTLLDAGFNKDDVNQAMKTSSTLAFLDQMAKNGMTTQDALAEYLWTTRSVIPNPAIKNADSGEDTSGYSETVTSFDSGIEALKDVGYSDSTINYLIDYVNHLHSGGRQIQLQSNIDDWNTLNAQKAKEEFAKLSTSEKMIKELGNYNPYDLSEEELMNLKLTLPQTMKDIEPKITYTADNFIPDFTKANPYENMPVGYIDKANLVFKPTIENPLPIYVGQHVDDNHVIDDNGKVITVSEFNKKLPEINAKAQQISDDLFNKENIKLNNGQYVSKIDFGKLTTTQQQEVLKTGQYTIKSIEDVKSSDITILPDNFIGAPAPNEVRSIDIKTQMLKQGINIPIDAIITSLNLETGTVQYIEPEQSKIEAKANKNILDKTIDTVKDFIDGYKSVQEFYSTSHTQEELKNIYNEEQKKSILSRIFTPAMVAKDKNGDYVLLRYAEADKSGKSLATDTIQINYEKIMIQAQQAKPAQWQNFPEELYPNQATQITEKQAVELATNRAFSQGGLTSSKYLSPDVQVGVGENVLDTPQGYALKLVNQYAQVSDLPLSATKIALVPGLIEIIPSEENPDKMWHPSKQGVKDTLQTILPTSITVDKTGTITVKDKNNNVATIQPVKDIEPVDQARMIANPDLSQAVKVATVVLSQARSSGYNDIQSKVIAITTVANAIKQKQYPINKSEVKLVNQLKLSTPEKTLLQQAINIATRINTQMVNQTNVQLKSQIKLNSKIKAQNKIQTQTATEVKIKVATLTKQALDILQNQIDKNITTFPVNIENFNTNRPPNNAPPIRIKLSNGSSTLLDQNKLAGAVGWKQGFVYKAIYKPYKQSNLITTKYKIQGIPYYGGVRSAFKSLVQITKGDLPSTIRLTMGIENIVIQTNGDKSIIKFTRNSKANKKALHIKSKHVKNKVNNSSIKEIK